LISQGRKWLIPSDIVRSLMTKTTLPFAITFDCDPTVFDNSLEALVDSNFEHLWKSIPTTLEMISEAKKISGRSISATFFIRNLTARSAGVIEREKWLDFEPLWKDVLEEGHYLGLHPHIDYPLESQVDPDCLKIQSMMDSDFQILNHLGAKVRVSRVGGHSYNSITSEILSSINVAVDSSAIPGRDLGKIRGTSDWRSFSNRVLREWRYKNSLSPEENIGSGLTQVPMCTLEQTSHPGFYRYIDFSFKSFEDHPFTTPRILDNCEIGVSVTHPSSLLEDTYFGHRSLEFGKQNWLRNFKDFFEEFKSNDVELQFSNLSEV
jgi:hypothetical protein